MSSKPSNEEKRPKRKVSGFDDFAFDGKGGDVLIPLADEDRVSIEIRMATGAEKPVSQIVLTHTEALKIMAEWWEFMVNDGINVAARIQKYRRLWREKNMVTIHSPRMSFGGPKNSLVEGPVVAKLKTTPIGFKISPEIGDRAFRIPVKKEPTSEPVEVKDMSELVRKFITSEQWNARVPVGTKVRYWPIKGDKAYRDSVTRSEAWDLGHGQPVVKIEGQAGGVALDHLCVLP